MTIQVKVNFSVNIKEPLLRKIEVIVSEFKSEIGGFIIGKVKGESIEITDIIFPKQIVSGSSVDIDPKDVLPLRNDPRWKDLLGFWHSHVNIGTFWSQGQDGDESHIRFLSQDKDISLFMVSSYNNHFEHKVRLKISKPLKMSFDDIPLNIIKDNVDNSKILNEIKQYIKKPKFIKSNELVKSTKDKENRKYNYDPIAKTLTVSGMSYNDYEVVRDNISITPRTTYYKIGWCFVFDASNKKEVGNIIREILEIIQNKHLYKKNEIQYDNLRGYFND